MDKKLIGALVNKFGQTWSSTLGIDLKQGKEREIFKWFLAALLFGKPIQEKNAIETYKLFIAEGIDSADKILRTGWHGLVDVLDKGGYVRYDFSTATKLLEIMKKLKQEYDGKITNVYKKAKNEKELEQKFSEFKGIGPTTINIFLRELRSVWDVNPEPGALAKLAAKNLGIDLKKINRRTESFVRLECALTRIGKDFCRKGKCALCVFRRYCNKSRKRSS